jgi:hypothetical protein
MSALIPVLRMDRDISLSEVLDLLDHAASRLSGYAKDNRDLSWNVVTAADLVNQARQFTARAIKEASCA